MSLSRVVSVHCDTCSDWEDCADRPWAKRRKAGWVKYEGADGRRLDKCPSCAAEGGDQP